MTKTAQCTYCHNIEEIEKDFGKKILEGKNVVERPCLYQIAIYKYREKPRIRKSGIRFLNTDTIDRLYSFNDTLLYEMALSIAKRYRDKVIGGRIKIGTDKIASLPKEWAFTVYDNKDVKQYLIRTSCVWSQAFQPIFEKVI